ncbi:hypothetical protein SRB17_36920 [Streptomyces sp. RB17]|nr:hypothetical protein [Streptomyces sp. RB17]MQY35704.1 hypothetical protein [Streptomyces sp. RB17]
MPMDPYAVLRALLRAEARRVTAPEPEQKHKGKDEPQRPPEERDR